MAGIQGEAGKYQNKFAEETERVSARIPKSQADGLRSLLGEGETISDKVREAIAYYLDHRRNNYS